MGPFLSHCRGCLVSIGATCSPVPRDAAEDVDLATSQRNIRSPASDLRFLWTDF